MEWYEIKISMGPLLYNLEFVINEISTRCLLNLLRQIPSLQSLTAATTVNATQAMVAKEDRKLQNFIIRQTW